MKLSDTHLILLSKAAKRDDRAVQLSANIGAAAAEKLVSKLAGAGLIEEIKTDGKLPIWRRVEDEAFTLRITDAGLKAIGVDETSAKGNVKQIARKASIKTNTETGPRSQQAVKAGSSPKPSKPNAPQKPRKTYAAKAPSHRSGTKHDQILNLLRRKQGASIAEMQKVSGWQPHSVRGFLSGTVKTRLGLKLSSIMSKNAERRYTVAG